MAAAALMLVKISQAEADGARSGIAIGRMRESERALFVLIRKQNGGAERQSVLPPPRAKLRNTLPLDYV